MKQMIFEFTKIVVFVCALLVSTSCQEPNRRPCRYLIPDGYVGWLRVDFNIENRQPLQIEEGHYLFKFPDSGHLMTSSDIEYGWASDEFYYYSETSRTRLQATGWGDGGMIWGSTSGWSGSTFNERTSTYLHFFVGNEEQFRKFADLKNEDGQPKLGNLNVEDTLVPVRKTTE